MSEMTATVSAAPPPSWDANDAGTRPLIENRAVIEPGNTHGGPVLHISRDRDRNPVGNRTCLKLSATDESDAVAIR